MYGLILAAVMAATPAPAPLPALTYYVRTDGGSIEQCDGRHDSAYTGKGKHQACAWRHPFEALPPGGPAHIAGGDTLVIGAGSYEMGRGAPGTLALEKCRTDWPWDCHMPALPSGPSPEKPTRLLGAGWDGGCHKAPELWGSERAASVLDLTGSSNIEIDCLEITDHSSCIEFHNAGAQTDRCERDNEPYGDWAAAGIVAADSASVHLADINIHGLAHDGIRAGRLRDWTLERVHIVANGWSGWNGDIGDNTSNSGHLVFRDVEIAWNGCGEKYPSREHFGCWGQEEGGYGDGLGTGETGGDWLFERVDVHNNTQDGLDLLHARADAKSTFLHVTAQANAGNQIKAGGSVRIQDSTVVGTCAAMVGMGGLSASDLCRAYGNSVSLHPGAGSSVQVIANQISGEGDCLIDMECGGAGCRGASGIIKDNHLDGLVRADVADARAVCSVWVEPELRGAKIDFSHNQLRGLRGMGCPTGMSQCDANDWSVLDILRR
jgi:hypothetical protein